MNLFQIYLPYSESDHVLNIAYNLHESEKKTLLRMDFATFRHAMINIPAQIIRTSRKIVYRLLAWNPWQPVFLRLVEQLRKPLRC